MHGRWRRPKAIGQVVFHFKTRRHGRVWDLQEVGAKQDRIGILFPDVMVCEYRHHLAFIETGVAIPVERVHDVMEGYQGLWWAGGNNQTHYLMCDGVTASAPI